ncbi:hypothetical protein L2Y96_04015 [Luteibacter aegosomaticola]|uniref:hypothetical protein n=1 Tax=Luteibacter aegosomaticola TaxID=2911538 RepID=UPI001FF7718F|nr:hypothetical protein [Luteibacter aegosomaticola]UPG90951.1 hypothetical protein L2Y96_04015 [Luteibacter aegosomaticola]
MERSTALPQPSRILGIIFLGIISVLAGIPLWGIATGESNIPYVRYFAAGAVIIFITWMSIKWAITFSTRFSDDSIAQHQFSWRSFPPLKRKTICWVDVTSVELAGILLIVNARDRKIVVNLSAYLRSNDVTKFVDERFSAANSNPDRPH